MENVRTPPETRLSMRPTPGTFLMRMGRREVFVGRDFRHRYYRVNPIIDCSAGVERGHLEVLVFRKWLLILSKAH